MGERVRQRERESGRKRRNDFEFIKVFFEKSFQRTYFEGSCEGEKLDSEEKKIWGLSF